MTTQSPTCLEVFQQLEAERTQLLAELALWPADAITFRPTPNAWSAIEILDHIVRAETGTIEDVRLTLSVPHPLTNEPRPKVAALDRALRSEKFFVVPADAPEIHPDAHTTLPDVLLRWQHARTATQSLLQTLTPEKARCGVFEHPFAGWMTFQEVLDHISAHLQHHRFQLARNRTAWESRQL